MKVYRLSPTLCVLSLALCSVNNASLRGAERRVQERICLLEYANCNADEVCGQCLEDGTIPDKPKTITACKSLQIWFDEISFPDPVTCNHYYGVPLLSDVIYCLFDSYALEAGIKVCESDPTPAPTPAPSGVVVITPVPTAQPTLIDVVTPVPTLAPTMIVTPKPTAAPTLPPTLMVTLKPTAAPTLPPTLMVTLKPTAAPTLPPTVIETDMPTLAPTEGDGMSYMPTASPTMSSTKSPTIPTPEPTKKKCHHNKPPK